MLVPGDWVEIRPRAAVAETLGQDGTLDALPFMPEMARYCGARFPVRARAGAACVEASNPGERGRRALSGCVVLNGFRCDGAFHEGCQLGCTYLWKEQWLRKVEGGGTAEAGRPDIGAGESASAARAGDPATYVCQGTELVRASTPGPAPTNIGQYAKLVQDGSLSFGQLASMFRCVAETKALYRVRSIARGVRAAPPEQLGLRSGDWVRVRSRADIAATLDDSWTHEGLGFSPGMLAVCGRRMRVSGRIETIVFERTGRPRALRNTVTMEGAFCTRYRGCAREMPYLWRELWLTRA